MSSCDSAFYPFFQLANTEWWRACWRNPKGLYHQQRWSKGRRTGWPHPETKLDVPDFGTDHVSFHFANLPISSPQLRVAFVFPLLAGSAQVETVAAGHEQAEFSLQIAAMNAAAASIITLTLGKLSRLLHCSTQFKSRASISAVETCVFGGLRETACLLFWVIKFLCQLLCGYLVYVILFD